MYITREQIITDTPVFIGEDLAGHEIEAIQIGGCASGAYMPAVTYHQALKTMNEFGDKVLEYIENYSGLGWDDMLPNMKDTSWGQLACHFVSLAVELWASQFEVLEDDDVEDGNE